MTYRYTIKTFKQKFLAIILIFLANFIMAKQVKSNDSASQNQIPCTQVQDVMYGGYSPYTYPDSPNFFYYKL